MIRYLGQLKAIRAYSHFDSGGQTCKNVNGMSCMRSEKTMVRICIHFMYSDCPEVDQ